MTDATVRCHVIIPTHLPRYLDLVLAALARQRRRPDTITVTCDTDRPDIGERVAEAAHQFNTAITWVRRPHTGSERLCQVRNNGVRALADQLAIDSKAPRNPRSTDPDAVNHRLIILDGDMLAPDTLVETHEAIHREAPRPGLIYAYRTDIPRQTSEALNAQSLFTNGPASLGLTITDQNRATLTRRDRRYRKHLLMRKLRIGPLHKPKLLGGHFSCTLDQYLRLNGFDELYQGWGFKDDEFAYRAARLRESVHVAVSRIPAFHLWHQTRQPPAAMRDLPMAKRFAQRHTLPLVCEHGVRNPLDQPNVSVNVFNHTRG